MYNKNLTRISSICCCKISFEILFFTLSVIFTLNLKIKLSFNDKEKVNFKGYNENEFKNFRDKLDKYNWIDD